METTPLVGEEITHFVTLAYGFTGCVLALMVIVTALSYRRVRARLVAAEQARFTKGSE